jgi:microcompartment protein CcmL/EutN
VTKATFISAEAIGLLEIDGVPRALRAQDAALKRAPVKILACAPVSPNKVVLLITGDVASVEESLAAADDGLGSRRIDRLFLPGVHPAVVAAVRGDRLVPNDEPLGIFELATVASTISAADIAVKATEVRIERMHLATGFGGRGFFTLRGHQSDVEAAQALVTAAMGEQLLDAEVIAAPHAELLEGAFVRPWNLDPADKG